MTRTLMAWGENIFQRNTVDPQWHSDMAVLFTFYELFCHRCKTFPIHERAHLQSPRGAESVYFVLYGLKHFSIIGNTKKKKKDIQCINNFARRDMCQRYECSL